MLEEGWISNLGLEVANCYIYFASHGFQSVLWCSSFCKDSGLPLYFSTLQSPLPQQPGDLAPAKTKLQRDQSCGSFKDPLQDQLTPTNVYLSSHFMMATSLNGCSDSPQEQLFLQKGSGWGLGERKCCIF